MCPRSCLVGKGWPFIALLLFSGVHSDNNPRDDFCRRYSHQTTVIDDKLYIDGGWVNFNDFPQDHLNQSNVWLGYHDLNNASNQGWPDLNIGLSKNQSIPTVSGGALWGDEVNKRFYLYGGDWNLGFAQQPFRLLSYDILYNKWDDFGAPQLSPPPQIASFGASAGVSETGMGYYYGGWISNVSMNGWGQPRTMSSNFYSYTYDKSIWTQAASPDSKARAEGAMVWIPAGDPLGLLIYMGGVVSPSNGTSGNGTMAPQPFDKIFVFDATGNSWSVQTATGVIPQNRRQFCIDVAWAPDKSSFNIYLWGGLSVPPPLVNTTSFNDIYILTIPSFTWVKAYPDHHGNATLPPQYGHYSASCNIVKSMSQLLVIGGTYPDTNACDLAANIWGQHNFWTGTSQNAGNNETYWAQYDPNITTNVVPVDVYSVVGGTKEGGATLASPKGGFDPDNKPLQDLLGRRPSIASRSPTRQVTLPTNSTTPKPTQPPQPGLSGGAIAGIVIGSIAGFAILLLAWFIMGRRIVRRRNERRQSMMEQSSRLYSVTSSTAEAPSMTMSVDASNYAASRLSRPQSSLLPPTELPSQPDDNFQALNTVSEMPPQDIEPGK